MKIQTSFPFSKATFLTVLLAAGLACSSSLFAKEFKLPNDEFPIASISIPADWKPEAVEHGVEAQTEDGSFYLSVVAAGTVKGISADTDATLEMLKEHKVKIDESSQKTGKGKVNEFDTESITLKGKDEDGPCTITILLVTIKDKVVIVTYWFTDTELDKHSKEVEKIQNSLKGT